jgi:hypothetical protein
MRLFLSIIVTLLMLQGCASQTGVISIGGGQFSASRKGAGFWKSTNSLKAETIKEAEAFCIVSGRKLNIEETRIQAAGAFVFPEAEIIFSCL